MAARKEKVEVVTEEIANAVPLTLPELNARKRILVKDYTDQEKLPITLAPMYAAYFGNVMTVSINGISIRVRVDGTTQRVPKAFANEIDRRRMSVDAQIRRQTRMSEVSKNVEQSPGDLQLF